MTIFWAVLLLLIASTIGLGVFLPVYLRATIAALLQENAEIHTEYIKKVRNISNINRRVKRSLVHWPIWPRPILYIDIDIRVQQYLAELTKIILDIEAKEDAIEVCSDDWVEKTKIKRFPLIEFLDISRLLKLHRQNLQVILQLENDVRRLSESIQNCQMEVVNREKKVQQEFFAWQRRSQEYKDGLANKGKDTTHEYQRLINVLENIHLSVSEGLACLNQKNSLDGLKFARLEICNRTAREAWKQFNLDYLIYQIEDNFDIDSSGEILDKTEPALKSILVNIRNDQWDMLLKLKRDIQFTHNQITLAEYDFNIFRKGLDQLKELLSKLQELKPSLLLDVASRQEERLNDLWYEYPEWERILVGKQEPSKRLEDAKLRWELYLQPRVDGSGIIKQSEMKNIVSEILNFQRLIEEIQKNIQQISQEISEQELAKDRVKHLLAPSSLLSSNLSGLLNVKDDTTDSISSRAVVFQVSYQTYRSKIDAIHGPNFKKLENEIRFLEKESSETIQTHLDLIFERQSVALQEKILLKASYEELAKYNSSVLGFSYDWEGIRKLFVKREQNYQVAGKSYRKLQEYSESAKILQIEWNFLAKSFREKLQLFIANANLEYSRILAKESERLSLVPLIDGMRWRHLLGEFRDSIIRSQSRYQNLRQQLRSLMSEKRFDDAVRKLDAFPSKVNLVEQSIMRDFQEAQKIDRQIDLSYKRALLSVVPEYREAIGSILLSKLNSVNTPAQANDEIDRVRRLRAISDINLFINGSVENSNINLASENVSQRIIKEF